MAVMHLETKVEMHASKTLNHFINLYFLYDLVPKLFSRSGLCTNFK